MITLLHGDHIEASRAEFNHLKEAAAGKEIRLIDGRSIDTTELVQSLESSSLFGEQTVIVIEQLFGKLGRQIKRAAEYSAILAKAQEDAEIVIWEDKELGAGIIKQLGVKTTVRLFKLPVLIFQFLDGLRPNNRQVLLESYTKLMETDAPELVYSMLIKRVRQLLAIASGASPAGLAPWQVGRLTTQAKSFTMNELISLYTALGDAEYAVKSGTSPFALRQLTEQVLITL